jgi:antitoxin VapB
MALNIKDDETDRLARELAQATGESITVAAKRAIEERLARVRARASARAAEVTLDEIILRGRERATFDSRSADDILGYDADGLPT